MLQDNFDYDPFQIFNFLDNGNKNKIDVYDIIQFLHSKCIFTNELEVNLNDIFYKTYFIGKKLNNDSIEKQKEKLINVQYPCKNFWNIAKEYDIKVVYGIDAHYKGQIALWEKLLELAHSLLGDEIIENLNFIEDINL